MSAIRLTGGRARGRVLRTPVARGVRPTSSRVREAFFSIVGQDLTGVRFLDAFGGAGVMALEAWSRGATVTVVEKNRRIARDISRRARELDAEIALVVGDVLALAPSLEEHDLVFADPPYALEPAPVITALASVSGELFLETASATAVSGIGGLRHHSRRAYGDTALHHLVREASSGR